MIPRKNIPQIEPHSFSDFAQFSAFVGKDIIEVATEDPEVRFKKLFSNFKPIRAAGGLLIHEKDLLLIFRNGFWDLPKGAY